MVIAERKKGRQIWQSQKDCRFGRAIRQVDVFLKLRARASHGSPGVSLLRNILCKGAIKAKSKSMG